MKIENSTGITPEPIKIRTDDEKNSVIKEAIDRATIGYDYAKDNMDRAEQSLDMIFGEHYSNDEIKEKEAENRIALTFNKLPQFINNVTGSQRATVQSINVSPTGATIGHKEPELKTSSGKSIVLSKVLTDLIRDIEYQSNATSAYKRAFKHALEGGFGWLRVLTAYQDDGFDLDIRIKGIRDRWSVIIDPKASETDKSDMNWAFITEKMSIAEFNKRYPGKSHETVVPDSSTSNQGFWSEEDSVTVAEYFRREPYKKKICLFSNGETHDYEDVKDIMEELEKKSMTKVKERTVTSTKVIWCKISAGDILEEEIEFPTTTIPLVPMLGRELDFRNKSVTKGLIDDAIDAQIALNKMRSSALERIDSSPLAPWIATDKSIEGYEDQWAEANTTRYSTLVYKKGEERPQRDQGSTMPVAELQTAGVLDNDMKDSIGIFNASLGARSNEVSGKAIKARQNEADVGTFEFIDNYQNAIRRVGLLCVEIIPRVYDTERIIRLRGADETTDTITINQVVPNPENKEEDIVINDLNFGKYTVIMSSGATYATKREESADQIMGLMQANPAVAQVGSDLLVKNLDFSESDVLAQRLEKTIPPNLLSKEKQEEIAKNSPPPEAPPPSPEEIKAQSDMQMKQLEMQMKQQEQAFQIEIENIKLQTAELNLRSKEVDAGQKIKEANEIQEEETKENIAKDIADKIKKGSIDGQST